MTDERQPSSPRLSEPKAVLGRLAELARQAAPRSWVPYSGQPAAVVVLLSDGSYVPGVRVENASYPLTIPPLLNAVTTATALGRTDIAAIAGSAPLAPSEIVYATELPDVELHYVSDEALIEAGADLLPQPGEVLSPLIAWDATDPAAPVRAAAEVAGTARPHESNFPVGCVIELEPGRGIPGTNVEHADWTRILCAERNALGTAISYGFQPPFTLYLSCPDAPDATPCGACRQVLVELAPDAHVVMDRGKRAPETLDARSLLPGFFSGSALRPD
ncbi:MAG: cytidine deaminase [Rhodothermales bacterium]|nr:cytidine deaminase [Rhodothermales bacterium]